MNNIQIKVFHDEVEFIVGGGSLYMSYEKASEFRDALNTAFESATEKTVVSHTDAPTQQRKDAWLESLTEDVKEEASDAESQSEPVKFEWFESGWYRDHPQGALYPVRWSIIVKNELLSVIKDSFDGDYWCPFEVGEREYTFDKAKAIVEAECLEETD